MTNIMRRENGKICHYGETNKREEDVNGCKARRRELGFKINIEIRMKLKGCGEGQIITKCRTGGDAFRRIFILFNDELFSILSPRQMEVFLNDGLLTETAS